MVNLYFQPDAQLTTQDRMVLDILQKDYERHQNKDSQPQESLSDSDDSDVKHTRFDSASPEGRHSYSPYSTVENSLMQMSKRLRKKPLRL
jgi:hypothetical protein